MSAIAWWALPILATLGAIVWASWSARRGPRNIRDYSDSYERFQHALAQNYRLPEPADAATPAPPATRTAPQVPSSAPLPAYDTTHADASAAVTTSPAARLAEVLRARLGSRGAAHR